MLHENLEVIKTSMGSEFDNSTDFLENEIKKWLVTFLNYNEFS